MLVVASLLTKPKPAEEIEGLVWSLRKRDQKADNVIGDEVWYRSPVILGGGAIVLVVVLNILFI